MVTRIYHLRLPEQPPRYVGKTIHPLDNRLARHFREAVREKHHRAYWLAQLLRGGRASEVQIELIEEVEGDGCEAERKWIKEYRDRGYDLVNNTDGGEGILGFTFSEESRQKMSRSQKLAVTEASRVWGAELGRRAWANKTEQEKREWSDKLRTAYRAKHPKKEKVKPTPEERHKKHSEAIRAWHASRNPEEKSATAKRAALKRAERRAEDPSHYGKPVISAEERARRSESLRLVWAALTPEEWAARAAKTNEAKERRKHERLQSRSQTPAELATASRGVPALGEPA